MSKQTITLLSVLLLTFLAACAPAAAEDGGSEANIQIIQPLDGGQFAISDTIEVVSEFADAAGATGVILQVSPGTTRADDFSSPVASGSINQIWQPLEAGTYTLQSFLNTADGRTLPSEPIQVVVGAAADDEAPIEAADATPTPTAIPATVIANQTSNCRFGPSNVFDVTGGLDGGQSALVQGRLADDSWWLVTDPNGISCWIADSLVTRLGDFSQVPVVASPPTPTPLPTATPTPVPVPAPVPVSPSGGLGCVSSVFLTWNAVSHPNGIDHYEWQLTGASSDSGTTMNTSVEVFLSCGADYEWSVRAVDASGQAGPYSDPLSFDTH
jgi:uncharacterized protein YgiM (DUF1202 family)